VNYAAVINIWLYGLCGWSLLCRFFGFNERNLELQQSVIRRHDEKFQISISFSTDNYVYVIDWSSNTSTWNEVDLALVFGGPGYAVQFQKVNTLRSNLCLYTSDLLNGNCTSLDIPPTLSQQVQFGSARNLFGIRQTQYYMINQHIPSLPSLKYIQT